MKKLLRNIFFAAAACVGGSSLGAVMSIREKLAEQGLDPKLAGQLAPGRDVKVYNESLMDRIAMKDSYANFVDIPFYVDEFIGSGSAFAFPLLDGKVCGIYLNKAWLSSPRDSMAGFGANGDEVYKWSILHELRHCSRHNMELDSDLKKDTDADMHAMFAMRDAGYKNVVEATVLYRSYASVLLNDPDHDSSLYLDAVARDKVPPSFPAMEKANKQAMPVMRKLLYQLYLERKGLCRIPDKKRLSSCFYDATKDYLSLPPLARRRVELFRQAMGRM